MTISAQPEVITLPRGHEVYDLLEGVNDITRERTLNSRS